MVRVFLTSLLVVMVTYSHARTNIVLILCDDMGFSDLGCYGSEIDTPNLDALAAGGSRFTQFYNNAKCTTTRASLITGLYPRAKGGDPWREMLRPNMATLGEALGAAGYHTALVGKWHLGDGETTHPRHRGFDEFYGLLDGACNFFEPTRKDPPYKGGKVRKFADNFKSITEFPADFYTTDAFTDRAIEWVRRVGPDQRPFFLHICYNAPHYPLHAWPEDIAKYRGRYRIGWDELRRRRYAKQLEMGLFGPEVRLSDTDSQSYEWETADQDFEDHRMAVYAAMIDRMDQNIGRLLEELKRQGAMDDTLILFLSDNGGCAEEPGGRDPRKRTPGPADDYVAVGPAWGWAQNAPFRRYKVWMQEGGVCTPMIAHWPGRIEAGSINRGVGHIIDLMPTFLDVAKAQRPSEVNGMATMPLEGTSLLPVLLGGQSDRPTELAWDFGGNSAIRQGDWKAVWDKLAKRWELFNLAIDRTEMDDLSGAHPKRLRQMVSDYNAWAQRTKNSQRPLPGA